MRFLKANGLVIHYLDEGRQAGPPVVFINSLGCDLRIWTEVALILSPDFRIVRYDKRGHGLSESGPDRLRDGRLCARPCRAHGRDRRRASHDRRAFHRRRDRAGALSSAPGTYRRARALRHRGEDRNRRILWDQRIADVERGGIESTAEATLGRWFTAAFRSQRPDELAGWRAMLTRTPREGYLAACGALKRADLRPYAGAIQAPTLCLVGDEDGSTPVALVRETAALIKGSRFEIVEGAGHLPNVEKPGVVAGLIAEHARRAAP